MSRKIAFIKWGTFSHINASVGDMLRLRGINSAIVDLLLAALYTPVWPISPSA
jgi:hypothetical protein